MLKKYTPAIFSLLVFFVLLKLVYNPQDFYILGLIFVCLILFSISFLTQNKDIKKDLWHLLIGPLIYFLCLAVYILYRFFINKFSIDAAFSTLRLVFIENWLLSLVVILYFFILFYSSIRKKYYWQFLISSVIFSLGILSFIVFIELRWIKISIIAVFAVLFGIYFENLYLNNFKPKKYQTYSLQNLSHYLNLISMFLLFSSFFGFFIFLQLTFWQLLLGVVVVTLVTIYQLMWISHVSINQSWIYMLIITLIIIEGFWVLAFLPTSIYVNGLLLATVYYLTVGLSLNKIINILNKTVIKRYVTIITVVIVITLLSAKWG